MADRSLLRLSTTLVVIGEVLFALVTLFHPGREDPNNHPAVFAEYASSGSWIAVHFGQFVLMAVLLAGLLVLSFALNVRSGALEWVGRFAAVSVVVALALYGVGQAVAGVGNKQLSNLHVCSHAHPARERDRGDSKSPQADWLPDGVSRYSIPRAKLGARNRGLRGQLVSRGPLGRRLTPHACVEHLATHSRLADEGARSTWKKANLSGTATTT